MRDLYEEYLDWLAEEIQDEYYYFKARFLLENDYTENEFNEFMGKSEKHNLIVITEECWEKCKENIKY